jgi:hypothetical protein
MHILHPKYPLKYPLLVRKTYIIDGRGSQVAVDITVKYPAAWALANRFEDE